MSIMYNRRRSLSVPRKSAGSAMVKEIYRIRTQQKEKPPSAALEQERQLLATMERPKMMTVYRNRAGGVTAKQLNQTQLSIAKQLDQFRKQWMTMKSESEKSHLADGTVLSVCRSAMQRQDRKPRTAFQRRPMETNSAPRPASTDKAAEHVREDAYESPLCFEIDFSFLNEANPEDQKLRKTLTENFWLQKQLNLEQFVEDNKDYLLHQFGQCACGKCTCGKCVCVYHNQRLPYQPMNTTYANSFHVPLTEMNNMDPLNQTHYGYLFQVAKQGHLQPEHPTNHKVNSVNIHKTNYKELPLQPRFRRKYQQLVHNQFLAKTFNQHLFPDWQDYDPSWIFKRPMHRSVVEGFKAGGRTTLYSDSFCKPQHQVTPNKDAKFVKDWQMHQTFIRPSPDVKDTHYQTKFQSFQIKDVPNSYLPFKFKTETEVYEPVESYQGQFKNSHSVWYKSPPKLKQKVLQSPWKQKLVQHLHALHAAKQV